MKFVDADDNGPALRVKFSDPPKYHIAFCTNFVEFAVRNIAEHRIWTFSKQENALELLCNGIEIFKFNYVTNFDEKCKDMWSKNFVQIIFGQWDGIDDTASDLFRPAREGNHLP